MEGSSSSARRESEDSYTLHDLTMKVEKLEKDLANVQDLTSKNYDSITRMLEWRNFPYLRRQASTSVVEILCMEKINGTVDNSSNFFCSGFVVDSTGDCLILTSALLMSNKLTKSWTLDKLNENHIIFVTFCDKSGGKAVLDYLGPKHGIAILRLPNVTAKPPPLMFSAEEESSDCKLAGMPIFTISHPNAGYIQLYTPSIGRISQGCIPVPLNMLDHDSDCLMYDLRIIEAGSVGAPILTFAGEVVGIHSSIMGTSSFGVGLKSIKTAFINYFGLSKSTESLSVHDVIEVGLKRRK